MKTSSVKDMKKWYQKADFGSLAKALPHIRDDADPFIQFLNKSNLLYMGEWCKQLKAKKDMEYSDVWPITLGADPEFILQNRKTKEVVLFSSKIADSTFNLSEAAIGADYGLLEIRTPVRTEVKAFMKEFDNLIKTFHESFEMLDILEAEAIVFDHRRQRILESLEDNKIDYGPVHSKAVEMWGDAGITDGSLLPENLTLSAYDEPIFSQPNHKLLTAGGHIHIGGQYVKMLSLEQMKSLIRKIDGQIVPLCRKVETPAGDLRRTVYGFPGEFRIKDYGFEYRSLSNAVFQPHNKKTLKKIMDIVVEETINFAINQ